MTITNSSIASGGVSTATTVPATDAEAKENARRGCAEARKMAQKSSPSGSILRVDGVPVISTPPERIRRRDTIPLGRPSAPKEACPAGDELTSPETGDPVGKPRKRSCKRKKNKAKRGKKTKHGFRDEHKPLDSGKSASPSNEASGIRGQGQGDHRPDPIEAGAGAGAAPEGARDADASIEKAASVATDSATKGGIVEKGGPGSEQPPSARLTASKAAAKPAKQPAASKKVEALACVKPEPMSHAQAVKRSNSDSFKRACSSVQATPSACPPVEPQGTDDLPTPASVNQDQHSQHGATPNEKEQMQCASEEPDPSELDSDEGLGSGDDLEEVSEEVNEDDKMKDDNEKGKVDEKGADKEAAAATEKDGDAGKKKPKRDKTPAQKAAHARYMRFSRSLKSVLVDRDSGLIN